MSLSFEAKTQAMRRQLATRQIAPGIIAPPLWRLLWKLGIPLTPPLFLGFMPLALLCGGFFAVLWGLVMYLASWRTQGTPLINMLLVMLAAGAVFGLIMATVYRRHASGLQLPAWSDYTGTN
jgi:hypothetical protein